MIMQNQMNFLDSDIMYLLSRGATLYELHYSNHVSHPCSIYAMREP